MDLTYLRYTRNTGRCDIWTGDQPVEISKSFAMRGGYSGIVNRDYDVPKFVNENTLFLAIKYQNTEKTLSSFHKPEIEERPSFVYQRRKTETPGCPKCCGVVKIPVGLVPGLHGHLLLLGPGAETLAFYQEPGWSWKRCPGVWKTWESLIPPLNS